jgi:hypothetical protein
VDHKYYALEAKAEIATLAKITLAGVLISLDSCFINFTLSTSFFLQATSVPLTEKSVMSEETLLD